LPKPLSAARRAPIDWWHRSAVFIVIGYLAMGRSFAYFGIPPLKLFIGEIVLFAFLLIHPRVSLDRIRRALAHNTLLTDFSWALVLLLLYGIMEIFRGVYNGYSALNAIQSFVFNYYPLYLLFGIWIGERDPAFVRKLVVACGWVCGIYGLLYIAYLSRVGILIPGAQGTAGSIFGQPWGSMIALLGLTCLGFEFRRTWLIVVLNVAVLLGMQVRAEWLGCLVGMTVYSFLTRRFDKLLGAFAVTGLFLVIGLAADLRLPGAASRGGSISTRDIVGRAIAPINEDLAAELTPHAKNNASTFEWRTTWWKAIWKNAHKDALTAAIGEGYGYPLVDLVDYLRGRTFLRTPHNMFFFALGYGGWLMVSSFALLQFFVLQLLIRAWRLTRNPFGVSFWAAVVVWSLFGDSFETPYGAIPFFVIAGACMAPLFRQSAASGSRQRISRTFSPAMAGSVAGL
jgi:hypothetical protein